MINAHYFAFAIDFAPSSQFLSFCLHETRSHFFKRFHQFVHLNLCFSLERNVHSSAQGIASRLSRSATHSTALDVTEIVEVDEEGDIENIETKGEQDVGQGATEEISPRQMRKEDISSPNKEGNPLESSEGLDDGSRYSPTRTKRERSADKNKVKQRFSLSLNE